MLLLIFNLSYLKFSVSLNNTRKKNRDSFSVLFNKSKKINAKKKSSVYFIFDDSFSHMKLNQLINEKWELK